MVRETLYVQLHSRARHCKYVSRRTLNERVHSLWSEDKSTRFGMTVPDSHVILGSVLSRVNVYTGLYASLA